MWGRSRRSGARRRAGRVRRERVAPHGLARAARRPARTRVHARAALKAPAGPLLAAQGMRAAASCRRPRPRVPPALQACGLVCISVDRIAHMPPWRGARQGWRPHTYLTTRSGACGGASAAAGPKPPEGATATARTPLTAMLCPRTSLLVHV
ncbi:MAG: hypothetical protein J3K34DRAFT_1300 [Monoraphidium minutum]|nr:MAG: hypothetical protein J3K34DRAFT_1300 [Monoraphidium minutum]